MDLETELIEQLPELEEGYAKMLEFWGDEDPGPHIVVGNLLNPFLEEALKEGRADDAKRALDFVERMAVSEDEDLVNVVYVTVCEYLVLNDTLDELAQPLFGPETKRICQETADWWRRFRENRHGPEDHA